MTGNQNRSSGRRRLIALGASAALLVGLFGSLPGTASALVINNVQFVVEPPANVAPDENFTVAVGVYNNGVPQQVAASITISVAGATFGCGSGTTVTSNPATGIATFTNCSIHNVGTWNILADHGDGWGTDLSSAVTVAGGTGLQLAFTTDPNGGGVNQVWTQQPRVRVLDALFNPTNAADGTLVSLEIATGPGAGHLMCNSNSVTVVNTFATFSGCSIDFPGTYTLRAWTAPGGPSSDTSLSFQIGGGGLADHLSFITSPGNMASGAQLSPSPVVQVVDAVGNAVGGAYQVSLSLTAMSGSGNLTCPFIATWTDSLTGRATITGCSVTGSGTFFLQATASGLPSGGASSTFTVGGSSNQVVFQTQPLGANIGGTTPTGQVGVAWSTQPVVAIKDQFGNTAISDNSTRVRLTITPGTPTTGGPGTLTCTSNEVTVIGGLAYFQGCSINTAGTGYQVTATVTSSPLGIVPVGSSRTSLAFNISSVSQLAFTTQPLGAYTGNIPNGSAGVAWTTQPVVSVRTITGTVITSDSTTRVQLSITPGTPVTGGPGTLSCTSGTAMTVTSGSAAFQGCSINTTGTLYQLRATVISSTTVPVGTFVDSLPFSLTMAAASISLTTYPSVVTWGDPFTATIQFTGGGNHAYTLQRLAQTDNGWQNIMSGTTDSTGRAVVQYEPRFNGQYKVVFNGDSTLGAGTSNLRTVNVRNLVLLRPTWSGVKTVSVGYTQTYQATARPVPSGGLPGGVARVEFVFFRLTGGQWVKVKSVVVPLNSEGVGTLKTPGTAPGPGTSARGRLRTRTTTSGRPPSSGSTSSS